MNAQTRLSAKGQIVIPKDVRDANDWPPGTVFDVVQRPDGILLRASTPARKKLTADEAIARIRATVTYTGPVATKAEWKASIDQMFRDSTDETNAREGR